MKKYSLFLLCLMAAISLHAQSFADYFADKTLRVDYIFTGNAPNKRYAWTDCLVSPLGQEGSIIYLSCPCKETDKSLCEMQPMAA